MQASEPPSTATIALSSAIISGLLGYYIGQARSIGIFGGSAIAPENADNSSSDEEASSKEKNSGEECKLVLVVRTDLGMTKGKIAAQCGHATLACYKAIRDKNLLRRWERSGQAKVALKADSEEELLILQAQAVSLGLCVQIIHDAGRTQIASGSATVLGIGPAPKSKVDEVTGQLKLL
ncbi:PTH2-domain-containing protein [Piedraia hortae CBS 480.64]|uniref:peptidyl-tRNA hydrolase n=1 Tax=Piedraia hortae CBS 480.64 TaxID=1314780 RepID=A0A6A7C4U0_9PEZI|nr:PTH2-domain-containing protein [Piedraia hortae CBS 480.64]